jgi:Zn-dependent metalloprotease
MKRSTAGSGVVVLVAGLLAGAATGAAAASPSSASERAVASADSFLATHPSAVGGSADDHYLLDRTVTERDGAAHVRYRRTYRGLPVLGGDFVVHSKRGGVPAGTTSGLTAPLRLGTTPAVTPDRAGSTARAAFAGTVASVSKPRLAVDAARGAGRLVWETVVRGVDAQTPSVLHVLTDARTGGVVRSFDEVQTLGRRGVTGTSGGVQAQVAGTGRSIYSGSVAIDTTGVAGNYSMVDPSHGNGSTCDRNNGTGACATFTDADNVWGNGAQSDRASAGVDAHYGAAKTFDYFKNVHGRNGIFGNGAGVPSRVHHGSAYVNAFWDGSSMTYGDGASNARPLVSIDVAGHEMGHGVTANIVTGGLNYAGESGGLNESASDIWGSMVEFSAANAADPGDYLIGEKIDIFGTGKPLRYMYDPKLDGASKNCWYSGIGGLDVHYSSGVGNLAYFLLAQGSGATPFGTAPLCAGAGAVTGLGRAKAEKIWYRAMDLYFTSTTAYVAAGSNDARAATLSAASDLYGYCSTEYRTVQAAWTGVNVAGEDGPCGSTGRVVERDINLDGRSDLGLTGVAGWNTLPVALSNGNGAFSVVNGYVGDFASWAASAGVDVLQGDFNGDGRADVALSGGPGWNTLPVAFSNGNGTFSITNTVIGDFAAWAAAPTARPQVGDFNHDGRSDIALTGVNGWNTLPVAFSNGNGSFGVTNTVIGDFASWAASGGVKIQTADYNGDGRADVALTGGAGWNTLPVAFSNGNGSFAVTNAVIGDFAGWATSPAARVQSGDFNNDGRADIGLTGVNGWNTLPVAFSNGNGTFGVTNTVIGDFASWAAAGGVKIVARDVNGDGRTDVALTGGAGWNTLPVAFSNGNGSFAVTNAVIGDFAAWATAANVKVVARDFNGDGRTDIALTGGAGWNTLPVAFSNGNGTFGVTNTVIGDFASWATGPGAQVI